MKEKRGGRLWLLPGLLLGCGAKSGLLEEEIVPCVVESALEDCNGVDDDCDGLGQDTFALHPVSNGLVTAWQSPVGGDMHVELLDGAGDTIKGWSGPLAPDPGYEQGFVSNPHITFVDDHILVIWHGLAPDAQPNPVWVRGFGCVP
jgi:hypothetical protein